jgi:hypothetical protein
MRSSVDKTLGMLSKENIREIAKFFYLVKILANKSDRNIPLGCCSNFSGLIYLFVIYLKMLFQAQLSLDDKIIIE